MNRWCSTLWLYRRDRIIREAGEFSLDFTPAISYTYMAFPSHLGTCWLYDRVKMTDRRRFL